MVDVVPHQKFKKPVTLSMIKAHKSLGNIALIKQSRLSVMPIQSKEWDIILSMAE